MSLYPMLLNPSLHTKVWGGRKLETMLGKSLPTDEPYGEAWELHDTATVANGPLAGRTLADVLHEYGADLIGPDNPIDEGLPLLVKFIDATDWLSVQVHPNNEQAAALEGQPRGKTEAWYMVAADPGAKLIIGVKPGTPREKMAQAIVDNTLADLLIDADVQAGDVLYIPAGTVHALGPGIVIYEIQQSSDTTYRLYDWGRMGLDGKPREMHIEKGVQVSNLESLPQITPVGDREAVTAVTGDYFTTMLHRLQNVAATLDTQGRFFHALTCIKGTVSINDDLQFTAGQTVLIPANQGQYSLNGQGQVLRSWQGGA